MEITLVKNNWIHCVVLCLVVVFVVSFPAAAAVTNGSFTDGPDGLTGWTVTGGVQTVAPGILAGDLAAAKLYDPQLGVTNSVSTLSQTFLIDSDATILSFWVKTPIPIDSETDHFFASLYDSSNTPLFNAYNDSSLGMDYLFHWDSCVGWQSGESVSPDDGGPAINETTDPDFLLYEFSIPVASIAGSDATLIFTLWNHLDYDKYGTLLNPQIDTAILIDNVQLNPTGSIPIVPVPAAVVLAVSGIMSALAMRKRLF